MVLSLIIPILILTPYILQESTQAIVLDQVVLKIILEFDHPTANENQIRTYVTNILYPTIESQASLKIQSNFRTFNIRESIRVHEISPNHFQVYPKFNISGETDLTRNQLVTGFKNFMLDDIRPLVRDLMTSQGARNIQCSISIDHDFTYDCNGNRIPDDDYPL